MAFGGALGILGVPIPAVEAGIAGSAVVLGLLIAFKAKPPLWIAGSIVALFAIFYGHAHGTELPAAANPLPSPLASCLQPASFISLALGSGRSFAGRQAPMQFVPEEAQLRSRAWPSSSALPRGSVFRALVLAGAFSPNVAFARSALYQGLRASIRG